MPAPPRETLHSGHKPPPFSTRFMNKEFIRKALQKPAQIGLQLLRRVTNISNRANEYCVGSGVEVGALSVPFSFTRASVKYADVCGSVDMRKILAEIPLDNLYSGKLVEPMILMKPPRYELTDIHDASVDFVYSSHSLEHSPNPLFTIGDYLRVVRPGGMVYSVIPNKEQTYDRMRETTPTSKLVKKYQNQIFDYTLAEAIDVTTKTIDHPLYADSDLAFAQKILDENSGIHHFHTFDVRSTLELIDFCRLEFRCSMVYFCSEGVDLHFCLRKND